ncbi:peptidase M20 [Planctomycetaceae bacterium SCGC AG-212-F19]|nr:peptidase M20 [Planctomycetaceae bacterium SCGC AG-212-F19]
MRPFLCPTVVVLLLGAGILHADNASLQGTALKDRTAEVKKRIDAEYGTLEAMYKHIHANPELSLQELQTSARLAKELKGLGFEVTEKVGGTGVVGVLKNGKGPTVLVRTDMDALPIVEQTGLPYASKVQVRDKNGNAVGVMHACGHDMHMTCWVGAARVLAAMKDRWQGTLVFIAQPAEEIGQGAKAMLNDGLYEKFPRPDYALALHCDSRTPHGQLSYTEGFALANVDSVDITVRGKGGHGSAPHMTIDPVVLAARIVLDLQTIVSRERDPFDPAVVTVGSIHGGTKHNIIPPEVKLQLTVRTTNDKTRKEVLEGIARIAKAAAAGARAPEPLVEHNPLEFTPATINDIPLTRKTAAVLKEALGEENVKSRPAVLGGEDFGRYAGAGDKKIPVFLFWLGTVPAERLKAGAEPLSLHSDAYYPVPEPSIKTGVLGMSLAVLNLVGK